MCRCQHDEGAHEHYRRRRDCALCDCPRFRRSFRSWVALVVPKARRTP